ncbi:MAG: linear amide C-N hydrolase [Thermomicrobiales bacterium]
MFYASPGGLALTGRTMDWFADMPTNLWAWPRGMERHGAAGPMAARWTSRYGSVGVGSWHAATTDGMNEAGLVANVLYLAESSYPDLTTESPAGALSIAVWGQYALDCYATVADAVAAFENGAVYVVTAMTPDGKPGTGHLALSDASGDSAILEYIDGKLTIHHAREFGVMTNSPAYEQQLALNAYWQGIGGNVMLPGTNRSADRFVRASYYLGLVSSEDVVGAAADVMAIMRNVSAPRAVEPLPNAPNVSPTRWRSVADQVNGRYYFEQTDRPNVFWVDLADLDLGEGQPPRRLSLTQGEVWAGNTAASFAPAEPMRFMPVVPA